MLGIRSSAAKRNLRTAWAIPGLAPQAIAPQWALQTPGPANAQKHASHCFADFWRTDIIIDPINQHLITRLAPAALRITALRIVDHLRRRFARFKVCAHFLQASKRCNLFLQFLDFTVLFEKLIEQHRVHHFIANGVRFPLVVVSH